MESPRRDLNDVLGGGRIGATPFFLIYELQARGGGAGGGDRKSTFCGVSGVRRGGFPPYIPGLHTSALPKDRITQPKVPQHSTPQHSTQGSSTLNPRFPNMRPWFKNASAYSTSTCPSHSKMPKSPVRAEDSVPEAQTLCVERFLRDLFNAPCHGSVCGGGRHQIGQPIFVEQQI